MKIQNITHIISLGIIHTACAALRPAHTTCAHCEAFDILPIELAGYPTEGSCYYYTSTSSEPCFVERQKEYYKCQRCQKYTLQNKRNPGDKCTHTNKQKLLLTPEYLA
ncbi:hypothetical protein PGTUg99_033970 [Puccinia graminis f. sp. tritici]|uniref:Secreted protein n=1 Tax=Puccinia graminis f. sp. tritici TaxID=56615 RepID=A0A5B0RFU2_PUCGR|nr:hypothetical protein PGTUg99_033970 [Puccinia graminis f. sp. tritici]